MITLDQQLEHQLEHIAVEQRISVSELIKDFILDYQSEREAIVRAEQSYAEYKRTGQTVSLDQLTKDNV
ncbi:MAG: ribbon-helix-helix protein, CopG family [Methylobacter sp.]|nr:MAG: ribbon-helix-helix protein, CopG family [Methylobacter sp.]